MAKGSQLDDKMTSIILPPDKTPKRADIIAAQKIIADISSGLYRSPAAALKELVSNAYDADATQVVITSDTPHFRTLTIEDDGSGMSIEQFLDVITHIGGSRKRLENDRSPIYGRKLIGRIGIGMLAVAQLGNRFYVSSSVAGRETRFIAEVNLEPFHRDDAALKSMGRIRGQGKIQIGAVQYVDDIPEIQDAHFTVITVPDAKKGLISEITSLVRKAVGAHENLSIESRVIETFDELIDNVRASQRADLALDGYYYMLWELALLCPINYSARGLFETSKRPVEGIESFIAPVVKNFKVEVDGVELRRPQLFPNPKALGYSSPDPKLYFLNYDHKIAGRRLRFTGYIYSQQPSIDPEELKGVHIRIRHVGIGKYDKSWLGYPFDEGIKFGQVTGEIYVEDGLEPALNIDRDSFRETDVHYQAVRAYVWDILRKKVFAEFKSRQKEYRQGKKLDSQTNYARRFDEALLELPAPLLGEVRFAKSVTPSISTWIQVDESALTIERNHWDAFVERSALNKEAQDRFGRVLTVLASSEILTELKEEEIEPLLLALAVAVQ